MATELLDVPARQARAAAQSVSKAVRGRTRDLPQKAQDVMEEVDNHDGCTTHRLAKGLGWFSLALGMTEILAPKAVGRFLGMEDKAGLLRFYGFREVAAGLGILASDKPTGWMWSRVGGDALDLATLAPGMHPANPKRANVGLAIAAVATVTLLDIICGVELGGEDNGEDDD